MQSNRPSGMSRDEIRLYLNPVKKWRVSTGAMLGASTTTGIEIAWRGFAVDWEFFHDRMQEFFTLEMMAGSIFIGALCGTMVCLIRNQRKGATDLED